MKMINQIKKYAPRFNRAKAAVGGGLMMAAVSANAALPSSVTEALGAAKDDGTEAGWLVVGIFAALFVIAIVKRLLR